MEPPALESGERAAAAGGCVAVYLRLQRRIGGRADVSGSGVCRRCCRRPAELAGSQGQGPGRPDAAALPAAAAGCCAGPPPGRGSEQRTAPPRCRPPPSGLRHLLLLLLLSSVFRIADCCSSRANPKPREPSPSTRAPYTFKTEACPVLYREHYCLNGATCFKVNIGRNPLYNCECADGFMGQRCEFKDPDGSYSRPQGATLEQASIAGGAGVALLVCLLLSGLLYVWSKRRRKAATSSSPVAPRFALRSAGSHVVQMEPFAPAAAAAAPAPATSGDVMELQTADRWSPPPSSLPSSAPAPPPSQSEQSPADSASEAATEPAATEPAATEPAATEPAQPASRDATAAAAQRPATAAVQGSPRTETTAPPDPQSRPCDRPP